MVHSSCQFAVKVRRNDQTSNPILAELFTAYLHFHLDGLKNSFNFVAL
jgi:hypothetical protein